MNCPKCNSEHHVKNGKIKGVQRYRCKKCGYNYTTERRSNEKPTSVKRQVLHLYLEGMTHGAISRLLNESYQNVKNWIEKYGEEFNRIKSEGEISEIQVTEIQKQIRKGVTQSKFLLMDVMTNPTRTYLTRGRDALKKPTKKKRS